MCDHNDQSCASYSLIGGGCVCVHAHVRLYVVSHATLHSFAHSVMAGIKSQKISVDRWAPAGGCLALPAAMCWKRTRDGDHLAIKYCFISKLPFPSHRQWDSKWFYRFSTYLSRTYCNLSYVPPMSLCVSWATLFNGPLKTHFFKHRPVHDAHKHTQTSQILYQFGRPTSLYILFDFFPCS